MYSLICPVCSIEDDSKLIILPKDHPEYYLSLKILDGTRKWYLCPKCGSVFCRDKIRAIWQYSPATYSNLLEKGIISNKLEDDL